MLNAEKNRKPNGYAEKKPEKSNGTHENIYLTIRNVHAEQISSKIFVNNKLHTQIEGDFGALFLFVIFI